MYRLGELYAENSGIRMAIRDKFNLRVITSLSTEFRYRDNVRCPCASSTKLQQASPVRTTHVDAVAPQARLIGAVF